MDAMRESAGSAELRRARNASWALLFSVFVFSFFVNALMLTGPIFMLQVYDRVLGSRSEETLLALFLLVSFLYLMMAVLERARGRVLSRIGARFQAILDHRVFSAALRQAGRAEGFACAEGSKDLEAVQRLMSSPAIFAVCDIPWTPFFLFTIFVLHPWLGYVALAGGGLLITFAFLNQLLTRRTVQEANIATAHAEAFAHNVRAEAELVQSLGMRAAVFERWQAFRNASLELTISASDRTGGFAASSKTFRLFLQSAMLGMGAFLVLQNEMSAGGMIAASVLLGRALAPVEMAIGHWQIVQRAQTGWRGVASLLSSEPEPAPRTALPKPRAILDANHLTVVPPGERTAAIRMVSFRIEPGQALGVIGQSGAGKSTLARTIAGLWPPASGKIRLDGAALEQYEPDTLGRYIGYLPQRVALFEGTIAENIARLAMQPDGEMVVKAAKKAGAHDLILKLPNGYDTRITANGGRLSGGQIQRIGLARAMYGDPIILLLDEPNSNLDSFGSEALNKAIRQTKAEGKAVIIMAHRPAAIAECDLLLVLDAGVSKAFGPRDTVLKAQVKNHGEVVPVKIARTGA